MPETSGELVTCLLDAVREGRRGAATELWELVYGELRGIARRQRARLPAGDTLQATALVHEAYLRLHDGAERSWPDRAHFFFAASRAMRDILVEEARKSASLKRGGGRARITLDESICSNDSTNEDVVALNAALERLEASDRISADIVSLRYFAGLTIEETAQAMDISAPTVKRHWQYARAWLRSQVLGDGAAGEGGAGDER